MRHTKWGSGECAWRSLCSTVVRTCFFYFVADLILIYFVSFKWWGAYCRLHIQCFSAHTADPRRVLQWLLTSLSVKAGVLPLSCKALRVSPHLRVHATLATLHLWYFLNMPTSLLSQGLCTGHTLCLEGASFKYQPGSPCHLLPVFQMSPFQWGLSWPSCFKLYPPFLAYILTLLFLYSTIPS